MAENKVKFDEEQYAFLKRCSEQKKLREWNEWRKKEPDVELLLEKADLKGTYLRRANLQGANLQEANLQGADLMWSNLQGADLRKANLQGAILGGASLQDTHLYGVNLQDADLPEANLQGASLSKANLQDADLSEANLQGARLFSAHLLGANLQEAKLQGAYLSKANLQGADLTEANLQGANLCDSKLQNSHFQRSIFDGATLIWDCEFDEDTNFTGVALGAARVDPDLREELEANIRRLRWLNWCKKSWPTRFYVHLFWWISDYGRSTRRVLATFFAFALLFAVIYWACGFWDKGSNNPGVIANLADEVEYTVRPGHVFIRALYFSVVTMTTLGFGDMHADPESKAGHLLLLIQVLIGYLLLAVLVTRLAVLFTGDGPGLARSKSGKAEKKRTDKGAEISEEEKNKTGLGS